MELFRIFGTVALNTQQATQGLNQVTQNAQGVSGKLGGLAQMAGTAALSLGAIGAAAVAGMAVKGVMAAEDMQKALNGLQAATGTADNMMGDMKEQMLDIYGNNFGESFEDIGKSMTTIAQQTGLAGPELADLTKSALALRDTFEFEVNESLRSAKMLSDQFGVTGQRAYDLIAQGAQKGLDKNGDLLDTINEYSVHFKQLGFNSDEMFSMLASGAADGTFSVDKLGDAVKEFGIRSKDGSKASMQAFTDLGLNADKMTGDFAKGGDTAGKAFDQVTQKLFAMKDPIKQNAVGTALFGTMWEDLGAKGVQAMTKMNVKINEESEALKKINEVKYNTFGEAMTGIGRQIEVGLFIPLGEKVLPILNRFAQWVNMNMPAIKAGMEVVLNAVGGVFDQIGNAIDGFMQSSGSSLPNIQSTFQQVFNSIGSVLQSVITIITSIVQAVMPTFIDIFNFMVTNVLPPVIEVFNFLATEVIPVLASAIKEWMPYIGRVISAVWTLIKSQLQSLVLAFNYAWPYIKVIVMNAINYIKPILSGLMQAIGGVATFVSGVFSGNWRQAWQGVKDIFWGIVKSLKNMFGGWINDMIDQLNGMINKINDVKILGKGLNIPNVGKLQLDHYDSSAPTRERRFGNASPIPQFASGGIVTSPTLAMVGEGSEAEAIMPLSKLNRLVGKGNTININVTGNHISNDYDVERIANTIAKRLRFEGVY